MANAGIVFDAMPARVDETAMRDAMLNEQASPRDVADALAEMKARKISDKHPGRLVIGCDQVLSFERSILSKPQSKEDAREQLTQMRGARHELLSAVVVYENGLPLWRHVGVVRMTMRFFSDQYRDEYLDRNWHSIQNAVGAYKLEEEGVRFFARIDGDYFTVLGLPLLELLSFLTSRGDLKS